MLKKCLICQIDRPRVPPLEQTRFIEPPEGPFKGWSLDLAGPFPRDIDGNQYLVVAVDPFSKWVEAEPMQSKHAWRTADFLWRLVARWGKPLWIRSDNGMEFRGSFARQC